MLKMFIPLFLFGIVNFVNCEPRIAVAILEAENINGTVFFTEMEEGIQVTGTITGLPEGMYGFHVHEFGNVTTCDASGAHFDPEGNNHGGRNHTVRHVGDLGNVQFVKGNSDEAIAHINFLDTLIAFDGANNILNRALVLHEQEDDLGLGGNETSLTTGNAGARVACGIINLRSGVGSFAPSLAALALSMVFMLMS